MKALETLFEGYEAAANGDCLALFYVDSDTPFIIRNPPANLRALLDEWTALDHRYVADTLEEGEEWDDVASWLGGRDVEVIHAPTIKLGLLDEGGADEDKT